MLFNLLIHPVVANVMCTQNKSLATQISKHTIDLIAGESLFKDLSINFRDDSRLRSGFIPELSTSSNGLAFTLKAGHQNQKFVGVC